MAEQQLALHSNPKNAISFNFDSSFDMNIKPGAPPVPDNQGPYPLCSSFALGKAIINGLETGKFTNGICVDIDNQESVSQALVRLIQDDLTAKCPTDFEGKVIKLWDVDKIIWDIKISVSKVQSPSQELTAQNLELNEYLISYFPKKNSLHCVYVDFISEDTQTVYGINSWGAHDEYPKVPFNCITFLYRVTCVASKNSMPLVPSCSFSEGFFSKIFNYFTSFLNLRHGLTRQLHRLRKAFSKTVNGKFKKDVN